MICLTKQELEELTGHKRPSGQKKWLRSSFIPYFVAADGYPRVLRKVMPAHTGGIDFKISHKASVTSNLYRFLHIRQLFDYTK